MPRSTWMCDSGVARPSDYNSDSHLQERRSRPKKIIVKTKEQTTELYSPFNLGKTNHQSPHTLLHCS